jgi:predicted peptidase
MANEDWRRTYPCFVVAPQTQFSWFEAGMVPDLTEEDIERFPEAYRTYLADNPSTLARWSEGGDLGTTFKLLDALSGEFNIDADRVYVLGHSAGGLGSWNAIHQQPELFAAAIPSAGGFPPWLDARRIRDVPVWSFHGSDDSVVPVGLTRQIFAELTSLGGNMKYTELKGMPHDIALRTFRYEGDDPDRGFITQCSSDRCDRTPNVWDWLFARNRFDGPSTVVQKTSWGEVKRRFNE